ncbi:hypothetical protein CTTA_5065 [Comamonas testosteroni]|uniref:Uncharacterized protein n=1 Tax=Comamonas testosteroni TaxID=285 RepID=A0A5A7MKR5_COMTE|nr:hypothetical protein [Comamonas testosteroni]GEQ78060.1 hypothetical protein CTTA_5065 [Comamonas testosteroni]
MLNRLNDRERAHLAAVKELPCSVCDQAGPSEAHHIEQRQQYTVVALCVSCHRGPLMGLHGQRRMWAIKKMSELDALNVTVRRLMGN